MWLAAPIYVAKPSACVPPVQNGNGRQGENPLPRSHICRSAHRGGAAYLLEHAAR
jgi:hypothetical protein